MSGDGPAFTVLFVCTGNRCRSPLAEHLLRAALGPDGGSYRISSAGVTASPDLPMEPPAAAELQRRGGDPSGFRARQLTTADIEAADLVLTATVAHRAMVLAETPTALRRTFTILEFASLVTDADGVSDFRGDLVDLVAAAGRARGAATPRSYDIQDPIGLSATVYREVADIIATATRDIAAALRRPVV